MSIELVETISQVFGNAPHLFLSILSRYRMSGPAGSRPSRAMTESHFMETNVDGEPYPEPPAAPPVIILSKNSSLGGSESRPQAQDPDFTPHPSTSFSLRYSDSPPSPHNPSVRSHSKPRPQPEPHPAPPVIILSRNKRPASSSPPASPAFKSKRAPQATGPITRSRTLNTPHSEAPHQIMGSKASKLAPKNGKLQSSQEKKDKEEMKEPSNYYTHRSKSMRKKAGKDGGQGGPGGVSMGSGGAGGAI
ncbi:hypothetical protein B5807_02462 [Epicoccum nigrum]|uniref:Uncharacterized protein n=1 Tax=Epicoccum nigrum TaxID=105696 RepID=A0A1Y2MC33_EPING|nr:hypothetical protein B5807_02462 [Epicoccum nigrum]